MNAMDRDIAGAGDNLRTALDAELEQALADFKTRYDTRGPEVERCKVTNDDEAGRATALAGILADIAADADKARVDIKAPYLKAERQIDSTFGNFITVVKDAKTRIVALLDSYRRAQVAKAEMERVRLEQDALRAAAAAAEEAAAGNLIAAAKLEQQAETTAARAQEAATPAPIRSSYGQSASGRTEWRFEVLDRKKLPASITTHPKVREAQDAVIAALVRSGTRELPGVRIYSETKTVVRR